MSDDPEDTGFLFDDDRIKPWQEEWQDMPEYITEKIEEYQKIIIRFDSEEDVNDFAKIISQNITPLTKSIWHPKSIRYETAGKQYVEES